MFLERGSFFEKGGLNRGFTVPIILPRNRLIWLERIILIKDGMAISPRWLLQKVKWSVYAIYSYQWSLFLLLLCINKQLKSKCTNYLLGHPHEERSSPQTCQGWSKTSTEIQNSLLSHSHNTPCLPPPHPNPPKSFCISIIFQFSWDLQSSQENLKTTLTQLFFFFGGGGGVSKVYFG